MEQMMKMMKKILFKAWISRKIARLENLKLPESKSKMLHCEPNSR